MNGLLILLGAAWLLLVLALYLLPALVFAGWLALRVLAGVGALVGVAVILMVDPRLALRLWKDAGLQAGGLAPG